MISFPQDSWGSKALFKEYVHKEGQEKASSLSRGASCISNKWEVCLWGLIMSRNHHTSWFSSRRPMVAIRNGELQCGERRVRDFLKESTKPGTVKGYNGWTFLPCELGICFSVAEEKVLLFLGDRCHPGTQTHPKHCLVFSKWMYSCLPISPWTLIATRNSIY